MKNQMEIIKRMYKKLIVLILFFTFGCSGFINLDMPAEEDVTIENSWTMLGKNEQRHHFSNKNITPPLSIAWKTSVKTSVAEHPLAMGNYVFAPVKSGALYILDYEKGDRLGDGKLVPALGSTPIIYKNRMYAGSAIGKKNLTSFELSSADRKMNKKFPFVDTAILKVDSLLFFGTSNAKFFATNLSGDKKWEFKTKAPIKSSPAQLNGTVVFGDDKGNIYVLNQHDGRLVWETQLPGNTYSHPVVADSKIFIGTTNGDFFALNGANGTVVWERQFSGAIFSSPSVYEGILYLGTNAHFVYAIDQKTGQTLWEYKTDGIVNSTPLPSPDYLYICSWDKHLHVINRLSGKLIYKMEFKRPLKTSPIIYRDYVLVHVANDKMYALASDQSLAESKKK